MKILDRLGISASALCAVHCAAVPVLAFFGVSFFGFVQGEEIIHTYLLLGTFAFAAATLAIGTWRHRDPHSWKWMFLAAVAMSASIIWHDWFDQSEWLHAIPMVVFGVALIIAHIVNMRAWHVHRHNNSCSCKH